MGVYDAEQHCDLVSDIDTQDDDILKRDYTGAVESQVDMSLLPKVMQVRDFGKVSLAASSISFRAF